MDNGIFFGLLFKYEYWNLLCNSYFECVDIPIILATIEFVFAFDFT